MAKAQRKSDCPTSWQDAVEERRSVGPFVSLGPEELSELKIDWLLLRPCVFPDSLTRNLSIYATLGSGSVLEPEHGERIHTEQGEICVISPSLRRRTTYSQPTEVLLVSYGDMLVRRVAAEIDMPAVLNTLTYRKLTDPVAYGIVRMLADEVRPGGMRAPTYSGSLALTLLGHVLRGSPPIAQHATDAETGLSRQRLARALQYVDNRLGSDLTLAELARAVDMSMFHFARAFKQSMRKTPHAYVLERRIAAAQSLVLNTTRPLSDISAELGFSNASHFSSVFGRLTGSTPSEYRSGKSQSMTRRAARL
jgi:AraC family transcriptional regulator